MRPLKLEQLNAFLEVAKHGSFTAAAQVMNLTQPAITHQIRELENRFQAALFERAGNRIRLTIAGRKMAEYARPLIEHEATSGSDADTNKAVENLIGRGAALLVPTGSTASVATKRHTSTIPIVFISVGNPVAMGLVESLAHPGGNATGFSDIFSDLSGKLVEFDRTINKQDTIYYLWHTAWPDGKNRLQATEQAAQSVGAKLQARGIAESTEIDQAIKALKLDGAATIIVQPSPFTYRERSHIVGTAFDNGLATIFGFPAAARDGALMAYGPDYLLMNQRAPFYVNQILKGTKPSDLPVQLPTKINLVVNLKTAKRLAVEVPVSLLIRADEFIE